VWLVEKWRLPDVLQLGVRHSHAQTLDEIDEEEQLALHAAMIGLSGEIADVWIGDDTSAAAGAVRTRAHNLLGLTGPAVEATLEEVAGLAPELSRLFELVILPPEEMIEVLGQAKQALTQLSLEHLQRAVQAEAVTETLAARNHELEAEAHVDPLTSLGNRRQLEQTLASEFAAASYLGRPLSLLFCDIDHFKSVNDTYGHHAGDQVLAAVAAGIADTIRKTDHCARFGGEEFVVLLPNSGAAEALEVAERIRVHVAQMVTPVEGDDRLQVTISLGAATTSPAHPYPSPEALTNSADGALYEAKRGGRNRVTAAPAPTDERMAL
jgi:diguanylate cyclase (GGDEF)-like protein